MSLFAILIGFLVILLLFLDYAFLPSTASRTWKGLGFIYIFLIVFAFFQTPFEHVALFLGVGRPVDILIYFAIIFLVRDFFISRHRSHITNKQITNIAREFALSNAKVKNNH